MLTCTEETAARIRDTARSCLRKFRTHPMYDDLESACILHALECLDRLPPSRHNDAFGIVCIAIGQWVRRFFTGPACDLAFRHTSQRGHPIPRPLPWEALEELSSAQIREGWPRPPVEPDFAPALIRRLYGMQVLREAWALMDREERAIAAAWAAGETLEQIGKRHGITKDRAQRLLQKGLNNYRERNGLPLAKDGTRRYDRSISPERREQVSKRAQARAKERRQDPAIRDRQNEQMRQRRARRRQRQEEQCAANDGW